MKKLYEPTQFIQLKIINTFKYKVMQKKNPKFTIDDVTDDDRYRSLGTSGNVNNLVSFTYQRPYNIEPQQRRMNRLFNRCAKYLRLNMVPRWISESQLFTLLIFCCVILSIVLVVLDSEFHDNDPTLNTAQQYINWSILAIFTFEVLLKWMDDFIKFWNKWNVFDLAITALTALPDILPETEGSQSQKWLKLLIMFRTLRFSKMLLKIPHVRFILKIVFSILKGIQFRYLFLGITVIIYVFAAVGVHLFEKYTSSTIPGLLYQGDFKNLPSSFLTMFSVFTMDHCSALLKEIRRVPELNYNACVVFIVGWYFFGAITLSNIIVGLIMDSFQSIRAELMTEAQELQIQKAAESARTGEVQGCSENHENTPKAGKDWDVFFLAMEYQDDAKTVCWHEDTLFKYLKLQERLQNNLEAKLQLQEKIVKAILKLHELHSEI